MAICMFMAQLVQVTGPTDWEGVKYSMHQSEFEKYAMSLKS
jgi:hypothetical protein